MWRLDIFIQNWLWYVVCDSFFQKVQESLHYFNLSFPQKWDKAKWPPVWKCCRHLTSCQKKTTKKTHFDLLICRFWQKFQKCHVVFGSIIFTAISLHTVVINWRHYHTLLRQHISQKKLVRLNNILFPEEILRLSIQVNTD